MFEFRTLGSVDLRAADGRTCRSILAQPKRVAILAYLALARGGEFHRRDTLYTMFWPEADAFRARKALNQSVYVLRRTLGEDAIARRGEDVGLADGVLRCDAVAFQELLASDDLEAALDRYRGELLEGFNLSDSPEFDRWIEAERMRLRGRAAEAAWVLAERAEGTGAAEAAKRWAARSGELAPYDESRLRARIEMLARLGDRTAAVQEYDRFAGRLAAELELEPSAGTRSLVEELRTRTEPRPDDSPRPHVMPRPSPPAAPPVSTLPPPAPVPPAPHTPVPPAPLPPVQTSPLPPRAGSGLPGEADPESAVGPGRRRTAAVFGIAFIALAVVWAVWAVWEGGAIAEPSGGRVAVLPFEVRGSPELAYLGEGMVDLVSARLGGVEDIAPVDPRALLTFVGNGGLPSGPELGRAAAARFDASGFILGGVVEVGGRIQVQATLVEAGGDAVASADVVAESEAAIFDAVDELVRQLLAARYRGPDPRLVGEAAVTTTSLPAFKAYLEGERRYWAGEYAAAVEAYRRAVDADSTFALANYRLSLAAEWMDMAPVFHQAAEQALRHSHRLPELDRRRIRGRIAFLDRNGLDAEEHYRMIVEANPTDVDALFQYAEAVFHYGWQHGRPLSDAEPMLRRVLDLEPRHFSAILHLARASARYGRHAELEAVVQRGLALTPSHDAATELRALRAFTLGDRAAQDSALDLLAADDRGHWHNSAAWRIAVYSPNLEAAREIARAGVEGNRPPGIERRRSISTLAALEMSLGRVSAAVDLLAGGPRGEAGEGARFLARLLSVPTLPVLPAALEQTYGFLDPMPSTESHQQWERPILEQVNNFAVAITALRRGDEDAALTAAATLASVSDPADSALVAMFIAVIDARRALDAGRPDQVLRHLDQVRSYARADDAGTRTDAARPMVAPLPDAYMGFLRATALRELGRPDEALRHFAALREHAIHDIVYRAPAHLAQAELHDQLGDHREALFHYARFTDLWSDCDPELRPLVDRARDRIRELQRELAADS